MGQPLKVRAVRRAGRARADNLADRVFPLAHGDGVLRRVGAGRRGGVGNAALEPAVEGLCGEERRERSVFSLHQNLLSVSPVGEADEIAFGDIVIDGGIIVFIGVEALIGEDVDLSGKALAQQVEEPAGVAVVALTGAGNVGGSVRQQKSVPFGIEGEHPLGEEPPFQPDEQ